MKCSVILWFIMSHLLDKGLLPNYLLSINFSTSDEEFDNDYPKLVTHIPPPPPFPTPPIPGVTVDKCVPYVNVPQPQCTEPIHESLDKCVPYVNVPPQPQQQTRQIPQSVSSHPPRSCKKHKRKVHKKSHQWLGEATKSKKGKFLNLTSIIVMCSYRHSPILTICSYCIP